VEGEALAGCALATGVLVGSADVVPIEGLAVGVAPGDVAADVPPRGVDQRPAIPRPRASTSTSTNGRYVSAADLVTADEQSCAVPSDRRACHRDATRR